MTEQTNPDQPWRIIPIEGVHCPVRGCYCREVEEKYKCNYADCPYSNNGEV